MASSGQRVGEYVLDTVAGRGAFGEVWRARHHVWADRVVAVKIPTDPAYLRELQREGFTTAQITHPNVVGAVAFDPFATPPYLAMDYVPGTSLRPLIAARKLSVDDSIAILRAVLAGLAHAHATGVVHRDVKPENILIDERAQREGYAAPGVVRLSDFGLGHSARGGSESIAMSMSVRSPQAAELVGTLDYMPPEQRAGGAIDGRADLFACGVVLFEMLTGERPVGGDVPSQLNANVPTWLDDVFRRAYARRESRFASAEAFSAALANAPVVTPPSLPKKKGAPPKLPPTARRDDGRCPSCLTRVDPHDQFCIGCGKQVAERLRRCDQCGAFPGPTDRFCIRCGAGVSELSIAR